MKTSEIINHSMSPVEDKDGVCPYLSRNVVADNICVKNPLINMLSWDQLKDTNLSAAWGLDKFDF